MPFITEAHALDRPDFVVPVIFPTDASEEQRNRAYEEAYRKVADQRSLVGRYAIVFACHEVNDTQPALSLFETQK